MGLTLVIQNIIRRVVDLSGVSGAALTYGVQKMPREQRITSYQFLKGMGFDPVHSIDIIPKDNPTYLINLDRPVVLPQFYNLIVDGGTIEHCFNTCGVLSNGKSFLQPGGVILHFTPMNNWTGHGFYQFSPGLFYDFYYDNGFSNLNCWVIMHPEQKIHPIYCDQKFRKLCRHPKEIMIAFTATRGPDNDPIVFPIQNRYRVPRRDWSSRQDINNWSKDIS